MALALKDRLARQAAGESSLTFDPTGRDEPRLATLPVALIDADPNQPRKQLGELADLAMSIREQGLINPLVVEVVDGDRYRLITGERRLAACRGLGLATVPCIVRTVAEHSRLAVQIIENIHRKELHPVEEARAFKRLMDEFNLTQRELAGRVGKSVAAINQTLRILDLPSDLLADVQTSEHATKSVLLEIAKETDPARREMLWQKAQTGELTVQRARLAKQTGSRKRPKKARAVIELPEATVAVTFRSGEATADRVCEALELALSTQRSQG
jgi:ParB family chromosome partitioning protein